HSIAIPRNESSLSPLRRDLLKQKQKLRQSEFAQISAEYMRINGITQNFKGLFGYQPKSHGSGIKVNSSVDTVAGVAGENSTSSQKLTKESPSGRRGFLNKNYSVANNSSCNQSIDACHKSLHHLPSVTTNGDELEGTERNVTEGRGSCRPVQFGLTLPSDVFRKISLILSDRKWIFRMNVSSRDDPLRSVPKRQV
uniref:Uncharacterized protein n=1 Tax=Romanomermis culicivorax TaxID=13658 RepID=A0A915K608_ROMCU